MCLPHAVTGLESSGADTDKDSVVVSFFCEITSQRSFDARNIRLYFTIKPSIFCRKLLQIFAQLHIYTIHPFPKMVISYRLFLGKGLVPCDILRIERKHSMLFFRHPKVRPVTHRGNNSVQIYC